MTVRPSTITELDFISDTGLAVIGQLVEQMPRSFDVGHMQGATRSVTLTVRFDDVVGPLAQIQAIENVLQASTLLEALYKNVVGERAARVEADRQLDEIISGSG